MPDKILVNDLLDRENEQLQILLASKAMQSTIQLDEFIKASLANEVSRKAIRDQLLTDLEQGGRIFGAFRNAIKATSNGTINNIRDAGQYGEYGIDKKYRWAAVLVNTCQDCIDRANEAPKMWKEWQALGLPRDGYTICDKNCRCMLVPAEFIQLKPVKVDKRQ